ncbi:MAG: hypothetical protein WBF49_12485 [Methyloceanibacter sp.]
MAVPHQAGRGLRVHLDGEEIVVWHRGTVFLIAFKKAPHQPRLIVTRNWLPNFASKPLAEFRARAAQLAVKQGPGAWLGELSSPWRASASGQAWWRAIIRAVSPPDKKVVAGPQAASLL